MKNPSASGLSSQTLYKNQHGENYVNMFFNGGQPANYGTSAAQSYLITAQHIDTFNAQAESF